MAEEVCLSAEQGPAVSFAFCTAGILPAFLIAVTSARRTDPEDKHSPSKTRKIILLTLGRISRRTDEAWLIQNPFC